jgi:spore germination cell wall hydrolase CwlJ-like protein
MRGMGGRAYALAALLIVAGCANQKAPTSFPTADKPATAPQIANRTTGLTGSLPAQPIELSAPDYQCLVQAVYFEAGGESDSGQRAVATVILNRVRSPRFPDTVCEVVRDAGKGTCQFSFWCDGKSDTPKDPERWARAEEAVDDVLSGRYADPTKGALFFHASYVRPRWSRKLQKTAAIGNHIFYR